MSLPVMYRMVRLLFEPVPEDPDRGKFDAIVFKAQDLSTYAYVLKTGKIYDITEEYTDDISKYCAATYCKPVRINVGRYARNGAAVFRVNGKRFVRCRQNLTYPVAFFDNFLYFFRDGNVFRIGPRGSESAPLSKMPFDNEPKLLAVLNDNIILLIDVQRDDEDPRRSIEVYSFNPSTFRTKKVGRLDNVTTAVLFYYKSYLIVMTGSGDYSYITEDLNLEPWYYWLFLHGSVTPNNWGVDLPIWGAAFRQEIPSNLSQLLVFFRELPQGRALPENAKFCRDGQVKFVQILSQGQCQHVKLPQSWLTREI